MNNYIVYSVKHSIGRYQHVLASSDIDLYSSTFKGLCLSSNTITTIDTSRIDDIQPLCTIEEYRRNQAIDESLFAYAITTTDLIADSL